MTEVLPVPNSSWAIPSAVSFVGLYSNRMSFSSFRGFRIRNTMFRVFWLTSTYKKKKKSIKNLPILFHDTFHEFKDTNSLSLFVIKISRRTVTQKIK